MDKSVEDKHGLQLKTVVTVFQGSLSLFYND